VRGEQRAEVDGTHLANIGPFGLGLRLPEGEGDAAIGDTIG
jgi:hypothetical protein